MALLSPGVEIKEIDASTIVPTVSDSTGVFCGEFDKGPINDRILITNPDDLIEIYGKPTDSNYNQFYQAWNFLQYQNAIYVTRVQSTVSQKSANVRVTAFGDDKVVNNAQHFEELKKITVTDGIGFIASTPGVWGNKIEVEVVLPEDFNSPYKKVVFGGVPVESYFDYYPDNSEGFDEFGVIIKYGDEVESFLVSKDKDGKDGNGKSNFVDLVINRQSNLVYARSDDGLSSLTSTQADTRAPTPSVTVITFTGNPNAEEYEVTGPNGEQQTVVQDGSSDQFEATFQVSLADGATVTVVELDAQDEEVATFTVTVPVQTITWNNIPVVQKTLKLTGGKLGSGTPKLSDAYDLYDNVEELDVDIIIGNEEDTGLSQIDLAKKRKDCIAFVGQPEEVANYKKQTAATQAIVDWRSGLTTVKGKTFNENTMFACLAGNYKYQYDRYNDKNRWVNLAGDIQGLRAQTNTSNAQWWASAGLDRGQIKNVLKLQFVPNQPSRDLLYKNSINPVTQFPGLGTVMWGLVQ